MEKERKQMTVGEAIQTDEFVTILRRNVDAFFMKRHKIVLSSRLKARRTALDRLVERGVFDTDTTLREHVVALVEGRSELSSHERDILAQYTLYAFNEWLNE